ncbi:MAG: hypothetical protein ACX932_07150 [Gammaproteobacteria bacterium]
MKKCTTESLVKKHFTHRHRELMMNEPKIIAKGEGNQNTIPKGGNACCWFAMAAGEILLDKLLNHQILDATTCNEILAKGKNRIDTASENNNFFQRFYSYDEVPSNYNGLEFISTIAAKDNEESQQLAPVILCEQLSTALNCLNLFKRNLEESDKEQFVSLHNTPLAMLVCYNGHWVCAVNLPAEDNEILYYYDSLQNAIVQFDSFNEWMQFINKKKYHFIEIYFTTLPAYLDNLSPDISHPQRKKITIESPPVDITSSLHKPNVTSPPHNRNKMPNISSKNKAVSTNNNTSCFFKPADYNFPSDQSESAESKIAIKQNYIPISDSTHLKNLINQETTQKNVAAQRYLKAITPALNELSELKNALLEEEQHETDPLTQSNLRNRNKNIWQLCGDIVGIINDNLTKPDFDEKAAQAIYSALNKKIETCLKKKEIQQSSLIGRTLRGIASLLLIVTVVGPLFSHRVRDHLFANHNEYKLNRAHRIIDSHKQTTLKT